MTYEEALNHIDGIDELNICSETDRKALEMAVKALKRIIELDRAYKYFIEKNGFDNKPCIRPTTDISECAFEFDIMKCDFIDRMYYCPNCGAEMGVEK